MPLIILLSLFHLQFALNGFHALDLIPLAFGLILVHVSLLTSLRVGCPRFTFDDDLDAAVVGAPLG
jgi:hypothetical protein